jgi:phospholipid-binding lipoprotein MlaA
MKLFSIPVLLFLLFVAGCAHSPDPSASTATLITSPQAQHTPAVSGVVQAPPPAPSIQAQSVTREVDDYGDVEISEKAGEETKAEIADPLEPFNRVMYHFNDKLYFWVLKPVAKGYGKVVPEAARVSVSNFFKNLAFPIRFVNCLLQANFEGAAAELGRFTVNTLWGIGGLLDPASSKDINLSKQDEDFGQTLGSYGLGQGIFITWPLFGPSSLRDTVGLVGDGFLSPYSYFTPWYAGTGTKVYDKVNDTSLKIGDYESLTEAAIDPYVAIRDAYVQYRLKKVHRKGGSIPAEGSGLPKQ